ncbi:hypothetical protein HNP52_001828 [Sphingomonas kyeonggiensis]|uniref:Uncharacterized protein n=1 Tax=Sphingomonas kyeonggiensis TaxID=1268553 RepID=A0A7W7NSL6_9SPHN|nr:hypothetical protein [Sphingomonas kyeonggiensis]MBB4838759.1 hypothetical protein [Sphingomonas kyeonggiensis]
MREAAPCICATLDDMAVVHIGGDGHDERVFATIDVVRWHGDLLWWPKLSRCTACGQDWMIAQEERIYDDHYLKRLTPDEAGAIMARDLWPDDFLCYEAVLRFGQRNSRAFRFLDPRSGLLPIIEDLRKERPGISEAEIGELIGISEKQVVRLMGPEGWFERIGRKLLAL